MPGTLGIGFFDELPMAPPEEESAPASCAISLDAVFGSSEPEAELPRKAPSFVEEAESARARQAEAASNLAALESRLAELQGERAAIAAQIAVADPLALTPTKIGALIQKESGIERLLSLTESAIRIARSDLEDAEKALRSCTIAELSAGPGSDFLDREAAKQRAREALAEIAPGQGVPLAERLRLAYPQGVPDDIARFFAWQSRWTHGGDPQGWLDRIDGLARVESERTAAFRWQAEANDLHFTVREKARRELEVSEAVMRNIAVLRNLTYVICGRFAPDATLARDLALDHTEDVYPQWHREDIGRQRQEAAKLVEKKSKAADLQFEAQMREIEERERQEASEIAKVKNLNFGELVTYLFHDESPISDLKQFVAGWGANLALKAIIADWPNRPSAHLKELATREIERLGGLTNDDIRCRAYEAAKHRFCQIM